MRAKSIKVDYAFINTETGDQFTEPYARLNPSKSVPTLILRREGIFAILLSIAALEYLEETFPDCTPLLPPTSNPLARATVRSLSQIIVSDTQPLTSARVSPKIEALGGNAIDWRKFWFWRGLGTYEESIQSTAGKYSIGDQITPLQMFAWYHNVGNAERLGVSMDEFLTVKKIYDTLRQDPVIRAAHWRNQPDTPEDLRTKDPPLTS